MVRFVTRRFISEYMNDRHTCYEHDAVYTDGESHRFDILDLSNPVLQNAEDEKAERDFEAEFKIICRIQGNFAVTYDFFQKKQVYVFRSTILDMKIFHEILAKKLKLSLQIDFGQRFYFLDNLIFGQNLDFWPKFDLPRKFKFLCQNVIVVASISTFVIIQISFFAKISISYQKSHFTTANCHIIWQTILNSILRII